MGKLNFNVPEELEKQFREKVEAEGRVMTKVLVQLMKEWVNEEPVDTSTSKPSPAPAPTGQYTPSPTQAAEPKSYSSRDSETDYRYPYNDSNGKGPYKVISGFKMYKYDDDE